MSFARRSAFTLIELLVVVAIIAVLVSMMLINLQDSQKKARDSARKADFSQIKTALELYRTNQNLETYPVTTGWVFSTEGCDWIPGLEAFFGNDCVPQDPLNRGSDGPWAEGNYRYAYRSFDGLAFDLVAQLEHPLDIERAEMRCWLFNTASPPNRPWTADCDNGWNYSPMIYAAQ